MARGAIFSGTLNKSKYNIYRILRGKKDPYRLTQVVTERAGQGNGNNIHRKLLDSLASEEGKIRKTRTFRPKTLSRTMSE